MISNQRHLDSTASDGYVVHLAINPDNSQLAANLDNKSIQVLDSKTLQTSRQLDAFTSGLNAVMKYSPQDCHRLMACTSQSVHFFDMRRKSAKSCQQFRVKPSGDQLSDWSGNELTCFDVNCDDRYVCAGSEVSDADKNSYLLFWDTRRSDQVLGLYTESHTNDVTDVSFHYNRRHVLATGGCDQLVNVFDLNETEEDDALTATLNVESDVDRIHWTAFTDETIACVTRDHCVQLWHTEEVAPKVTLNASTSPLGFDYVIDVLATDGLVYVADNNHSIKTFDINSSDCSETIHFKECLTGGHNQMVRTVAADNANHVLYSGGEDTMVYAWNRLETSTPKLSHKSDTKIKSKKQKRDKRLNPY